MYMDNSVLRNPFVVNGTIPEDLFCDRNEETMFLVKQVRNGRNTVLVSPRRMGKTGLIRHLFRQPDMLEAYNAFFVDLYATSSLQELCYVFGKTVFDRLKTRKALQWESFFQTIKSLRAGFKIDPITGEPKFELGIGAIESPVTTLEEIFSYLESADKPCVVAFDEFQQVAEFQEKRVEAMLRGLIQNCSHSSFIFCGSKQHTISQMFHTKARPFYQSAQLMDLRPLDREVYIDFAVRLFSQYDKRLERDVVDAVYGAYHGTTWYMQMVMNELFALTPKEGTCGLALLPQARQNIVEVQEGTYRTQLSMLSTRQKLVLQAIAREVTVKSVTSGSFIKKYSLDSPSSVQSALRGLMEKEIVSSGEEGYSIGDFFFSEWMRERF